MSGWLPNAGAGYIESTTDGNIDGRYFIVPGMLQEHARLFDTQGTLLATGPVENLKAWVENQE